MYLCIIKWGWRRLTDYLTNELVEKGGGEAHDHKQHHLNQH